MILFLIVLLSLLFIFLFFIFFASFLLSLLPILYFSIILNYVCADVIKGQRHKIPLEMGLQLIMIHKHGF